MLPDNKSPTKKESNASLSNKSYADAPAIFNIYDIPADQNFIQSLAQGILDEIGDDVLALADYTIILPTRSNAHDLRKAFVELSKGASAIMPRIDTPRDFDNEEASLKIAHSPILSETLMDLPPSISPLQRKLLLAKEILSVPGMASSPEKAVRLSEELSRFLDFTQKHGVELKNLDNLAPEKFSEQWKKTRDFLEILTERWPKILAELGMIDPQDHKNAVTSIQASHWVQTPTERNVIIAGFTHVSPAECGLFSAVANLPNGRVVFSGLDNHLDDESWDAIDEAHPQYGMKQILDNLPIDRDTIKEWKTDTAKHQKARSPNVKATIEARKKLISESMRPAATADRWLTLKQAPAPNAKTRISKLKDKKTPDNIIDARALTGMDLVTCGTPQQEASVIALKMRESLETPNRTTALITTDRSLARRVAARLKYWDINVQDSIGRSLADTETGIWMRLTAAMAADNLSPITTLSCLKHPYATLGDGRKETLENIQKLEKYLLRGPRPEPGLDGLKKRLTTVFNNSSGKRNAREQLKNDKQVKTKAEKRNEELSSLKIWLNNLSKMAHPFLENMRGEKQPFSILLDKHIEFAELLANEKEIQGTAKLWTGMSGSKSSKFLSELRKYSDSLPEMTGEEYSGILSTLMKSITVKPKPPSHSNLYILSPREARLFKADTMIMAGLNEDTWPNPIHEINWLSRDMLEEIKLPSSDLHLGKSANDFSQILSSPDVLITRAERNGDVPTVTSPFLTRLRMVLQKTNMLDKLESKNQLVAINDALNTPSKISPIERPEPKPPKEARPKRMSVSSIETLLRDPYSLYARQILKLYPHEKIDEEPSARERGNFIHEILDQFISKYPDKMPKDPYDKLLDIGKEVFNERLDNPTVQAFWWPRFEYMAEWFVKEETTRRKYAKTEATEAQGQLDIETKHGKFTLTAIADRIDRMSDDSLSIIDYKTGSVPTKSAVTRGFSPQLTLEALIALAGGFKNVDAGDVGSLEYWKLSGGKPPGKIIPIRDDINKLEQEALKGLTTLIETFLDENTPYLHAPRPRLAPRFNAYKHLAREEEWKYEQHNKKKTVNKSGPKRDNK